MQQGLYFLHEQPLRAQSWNEPRMKDPSQDYRVWSVWGNMCMFGMEGMDELGTGLVKKDTRFATNLLMIAERLNRVCTGGRRHVNLINGRAKMAEVYPHTLCTEILRGLVDQMKWDGRMRDTGLGLVFVVEEGEQEIVFWDSVSGQPLDFEGVLRARREELDEFAKHKVYHKVPIQECYECIGKRPIGTKWVDINKGDTDNPEYPSRLVAMEIRRDSRSDLFAAIPPLEAKKMLFSLAVTDGNKRTGMKLDFIDVKRAYF